MNDPFVHTYPNIITVEKPTDTDIKKYVDLLPTELINLWKEFGWGIYMDGFLRIINPKDIEEFIGENVEIVTKSVPFAVTAFGDILLWLCDGYVEYVSFRKAYREIVESGMDLFINDTLPDFNYTLRELRAEQYAEAKVKLGVPAYNQCYGYFPLLALGGYESVDKLQIVDLQTHLELMAQVVGPL